MAPQASTSSSTQRDSEKNFGPEAQDYDIMEQIGTGTISSIYLVTCKRGRLRNRQLALRKVSYFHLTISEGHLRGVLKGLTEALIYLKKQGVVHRNIKPSNILLTNDGRIKLSDFTYATRLPPSKVPTDLTKAPHFVAPPSNTSENVLSKHALFESSCGPPKSRLLPFPSKIPTDRKQKRHSYAPTGFVLNDIGNTDRRNAARSEIIPGIRSTRRIVSDPLPGKPVDPASEAGLTGTSSRIHQCEAPRQRPSVYRTINEGWVSTGLFAPSGELKPPDRYDLPDIHSSTIPLPVGTMRPSPFTVSPLSPESHRTVHGHVIVLPSCSLLVDFREGERRRETLPSVYWRQYNDAGALLERIKQRTPKLVLHIGSVKCTLMANTPRGDVELLFQQFGHSSPQERRTLRKGHQATETSPWMRIRLSRQGGSVEIAKHISRERGEEWTKKVLKIIDEDPHVSALDWDTLDATERASMVHLARFWRICEALELLDIQDSQAYPDASSVTSNSRSKTLGAAGSTDLKNLHTRAPSIEKPGLSSAQTLPLASVPPRPPKLPLTSTTKWRSDRVPFSTDMASIEVQNLSTNMEPAILPTWCQEEDFGMTTTDRRAPQTRFIPSVGWCVRHSSRVSQCGRYKIMFFDGTSLEIDVDEDWAEFTNQAGESARHSIRDCNSRRDIADRMKVFGDFVSMFDEAEER
ncbi:hypothetical protein B0H10DRAFT_1946718 [Mycena sp. CBHHK59/15]|nr:hypothetical protein B0H10DRAFT_1946718 [Mycena sp. CBHHK59/15]